MSNGTWNIQMAMPRSFPSYYIINTRGEFIVYLNHIESPIPQWGHGRLSAAVATSCTVNLAIAMILLW